MNFAETEQQCVVNDALRRQLSETCAPAQVHAAIDAPDEYDVRLWQQLCEFGLPGLLVDAEHDGSELEMIDAAFAAEALGYHGAPVPFLAHTLAVLALKHGADAELAARWLPRLAAGEVLATVALLEDGEGWLPEQWTLEAGAGLLSGKKTMVEAGLGAELIVVGLKGGVLALVEAGAAGITRTALDGIDRTRRMATLEFDATPVTLLAPAAAQRVCDAALVLLAADAFGGARRALDMAVQYAGEREQFGVKIGQFQALKHALANMALEIEPCRGLYWYAAHAFDHLPAEASSSAALAKAHIAERFLQAARDAVEAHGGIGYTWEYDIHIWLKRAMFDFAWNGSPESHRVRYAHLVGW
jgi:alkylation response protein AidB-like acyl-CoA dehydrogenase